MWRDQSARGIGVMPQSVTDLAITGRRSVSRYCALGRVSGMLTLRAQDGGFARTPGSDVDRVVDVNPIPKMCRLGIPVGSDFGRHRAQSAGELAQLAGDSSCIT